MSADADLNNMWNEATQDIANIDPAAENWKIQSLPLARVKKIMKSEEIIMQELERERLRRERAEGVAGDQERTNVKFMISGEAPVLMSKACELLIKDLSFRAWQHTERNRRRTLQRQDLHAAVGESEVYDFLIDIVPRVQAAAQAQPPAPAAATTPTVNAPDMTMMQATLPPGFQVQQMAQVTAGLNQATMQHAQAMAAAVPVGAPPPAAPQQTPAPAGLDPNATNPPATMIQYAQVPTDALNHLVHPWDPTQLAFTTAQVTADSSDAQAVAAAAAAATANPVPVGGPAPQPAQHHQQPAIQHTEVPQQPQHQQLQPPPQQQHQALQPPPQQPHQPPPQQPHQPPPPPQQQQQQQQQTTQQPQQQQQLQVPQPTNHQQWMDPATIAAMGAAPSAQQAPGV